MAKPKSYKTNSGGHVRLYLGEGGTHVTVVDVPAGGEYTTEDEQEQEALDASSEVSEVKAERGKAKKPEVEADEESEETAQWLTRSSRRPTWATTSASTCSADAGALIAIDAACDICRDVADQTFNLGTATVTLDGTGTDMLLLPQAAGRAARGRSTCPAPP